MPQRAGRARARCGLRRWPLWPPGRRNRRLRTCWPPAAGRPAQYRHPNFAGCRSASSPPGCGPGPTSTTRPFQEATVAAYTDAARSLDRWMTGEEIDGDFTACDAEMLDRFLTGRLHSHGQQGLNTPAAQPAAPVHLAGGGLRPPAPVYGGAAPVCAGEEAALHAGAGVHRRPAGGNRRGRGARLTQRRLLRRRRWYW